MDQYPNSSGSDDNKAKKPIVDEAKQVATHAADQVRERATSTIASQKDRAVSTIGNVAEALRETSDKMKDSPLSGIADKAADGVEGFANYFKTRNVGDIFGEVERFARREPAIFLGASFALGLFGGRFLKSSAKSNATPGGPSRSQSLGQDDPYRRMAQPSPERFNQSTRDARVEVRPTVSVGNSGGAQSSNASGYSTSGSTGSTGSTSSATGSTGSSSGSTGSTGSTGKSPYTAGTTQGSGSGGMGRS
ncbi:MAG: hypothetical protein NVS3B20_12670 [Polyangiales bacterium]